MKAAQFNTYGDASVIEINDVDIPALKEGYVLVENYATSINPFDSKIRSGMMKGDIKLDFPYTIGGDFAGIIKEVGGGVSHLKPGDKVYGQAYAFSGASGTFAEFVLAKEGQTAHAPEVSSFEELGALPLVGVSAVQALMTHIHLQRGQRIFIHGGAGAIGSIAIQIAKHLGAYVATTASGEDLAYVTQLGADEVIDYKVQQFSDILSGMDAAFDTVGSGGANAALRIVKRGGVVVSMVDDPDEETAEERGVQAIKQGTKVTTEALSVLSQLVEDGVVHSRIGKIFSLDHSKEAFTERENGMIQGKTVVRIREHSL